MNMSIRSRFGFTVGDNLFRPFLSFVTGMSVALDAVMLDRAGGIAIDFMGPCSQAETIRLRLKNDKVPITANQSGLLQPAHQQASFAAWIRNSCEAIAGSEAWQIARVAWNGVKW